MDQDKKTQLMIDNEKGRQTRGTVMAVLGALLIVLGLLDSFEVLDVPGLYGTTLVIGGVASCGWGAAQILKARRTLAALK